MVPPRPASRGRRAPCTAAARTPATATPVAARVTSPSAPASAGRRSSALRRASGTLHAGPPLSRTTTRVAARVTATAGTQAAGAMLAPTSTPTPTAATSETPSGSGSATIGHRDQVLEGLEASVADARHEAQVVDGRERMGVQPKGTEVAYSRRSAAYNACDNGSCRALGRLERWSSLMIR